MAQNKLSPQGVSYSTLPHFVNSEGQYIFCKYWEPALDEGDRPRALLCIIHGVGEHILKYDYVAQQLIKEKLFVFGHDHVGHGKSEGDRAHIEKFSTYVDDAIQHVYSVKEKYPDIPVFLLGHSMGGAVSVMAANENPTLFQGVILIGPSLAVNPVTVTPVKIFMAKMAARFMPQLQIEAINPEWLSRDPETVKAYTEDPLVYHGGLKARWACRIMDAMFKIMENASKIEWPYLLLHGDADLLCEVGGSKEFHEKTSSKDKTFKLYEGFYHQLHGEPFEDKKRVLNDITEWIKARV